MRFDDLARMYASWFRQLGPDDGLDEWIDKVERPEIVADTMRIALEKLDKHHRGLSRQGEKYIAAPRLGEVLAYYWQQVDEDRKAAYQPPSFKCHVCGGTGWGWGVKSSKGNWIGRKNPEARPGEGVYISLIPCTCMAQREQRYSNERRHREARYIVTPCNGALCDVRELRGECERLTREAERNLEAVA